MILLDETMKKRMANYNPDAINAYQKMMCKPCLDKINKKVESANALLQSPKKYQQLRGKAKMAKLSMTLWKDLCKQCVNKIKNNVSKVGL